MNRRMIITAASVAIFLGASALPVATANAAPTTQTTSGQGRMEKLKQALSQLDLTTGQKRQIKQIMADARSQLKTLKENAAGGSIDKTQARAIIKDAMKKVMAELTPSQKTKLKEILKADRATTHP